MRKIYNRQEILDLEKEELETRSDWEDNSELLSHKSIAICNRIRHDFYASQRAIVFAGPNEKGALAIKVANTLLSLQYEVEVVLLNPFESLPADVVRERDNFLDNSPHLLEVTGSAFTPPSIKSSDLLIDGVQGISTISNLNNIIKYLNSITAHKIAIEIPSGMSEETEVAEDFTKIFRADVTYTFYSPKLPFLFKEYAPYVGRWSVVTPSFFLPKGMDTLPSYALFDTQEMENVLQRRPRFSNKYDYGKVLLIAGQEGMMGAAILAGKAAITTGAGHVTLHVPKGKAPIIHIALPEVLVQEDLSEESFSSTNTQLGDFDAIAVGPGIGRSTESYLALEQLLSTYDQPLILDADALTLLAQEEGRLLELLPKNSIITPHEGEFDRLFGPSKNSRERLEKAKNKAQDYGIYILLKGTYTATCLPTGEIIYNTSGNSGLATAGTGDVLTGIILALRGMKCTQKMACTAAAFLHGFAAENYANDWCETSLTASRLIDYLPSALKRFTSDNPSPWA